MEYIQYSNTFASIGAVGQSDDMAETCKTLIKHYGKKRKLQQPLIKWAKYTDNRRLKQNFLELYAIEIEHDAGTMQMEEACEKLHNKGFPFVAYETWSHTPESPRWRMFLPLEKALTIKELGSYEEVEVSRTVFVKQLAEVLGDGIISRESWSLSQHWYIGHEEGLADPKLITNLK